MRDQEDVPAGHPAASLRAHYPQPLPATPEEICRNARAARFVERFDCATFILVVIISIFYYL